MKLAALASLFLLSIVCVTDAWTPRTYQVIVGKSMRLMPASFRSVMLRHQKEILLAAMKPDEIDETRHHYSLEKRAGYLQDRVVELTKAIPGKIRKQAHFREVAVDFGRLAHYIADLNDPLILGDSDRREDAYRIDFAIYLQKNIEKFPWIFDGHENELLKQSRIEEYIHFIASRAVERYPLLGQAYFPNGMLVSSDTFDPKSLPFGIASLSYSHSITNIVQIWFHTWRSARGDIRHTPFYSR